MSIHITDLDIYRAHADGQIAHAEAQRIAKPGLMPHTAVCLNAPHPTLWWAWDMGWRLAEHLRPHVQAAPLPARWFGT